MSQFNIGDAVVIARKSDEWVAGEFENNWCPSMDKFVNNGTVYRISYFNKNGIRLDNALTGDGVPHLWSPQSLQYATKAAKPAVSPPKYRPKFQPGDRVRIVRKAPDKVKGEFENSWISEMDEFIGKPEVYTIKSVAAAGVHFKLDEPLVNYRKGAACAWPPACMDFAEENNRNTNPTTKSEEDSMTMNLKIEDRVYINGTNAADFDDAALVAKIMDAEAEIEKLKGITTESAAIKARIAELQAGVVRVAALLDSRAAA